MRLGDDERYRIRQAETPSPRSRSDVKAWLFADTPRGANASATCYSLIETAEANDLEPSAYIHHILKHIGEADTVEKLEARFIHRPDTLTRVTPMPTPMSQRFD